MTTAATTAPSGLADQVAAAAERARAVDAAEHDLRDTLRGLGEGGLLDLGAGHGSLAEQAEAIRALGTACTATAFSVWAHRMAVGYLHAWGGDAVRDELLDELRAGRRPGATAMATAFQAALGLKELTVHGRVAADGSLRLDGTIPWASNLFDQAVVIVPVAADDGRSLIVAITTDQAGVDLVDHPRLLALQATASTTVRLTDVAVPAHRVLTDRFLDFLADVRPAFLLLQAAFALGLADASLSEAAARLAGPTEVLADELRSLTDRREELGRVFEARLARPGRADEELVRLRLDAACLAVEATRLESTVAGGAGYLAHAATARRLREAAFLPIQSPTEAQLRWELSRSA